MARKTSLYAFKSWWTRYDGYGWIPLHLAAALGIHEGPSGDLEGIPLIVATMLIHGFIHLCTHWWVSARTRFTLNPTTSIDKADVVMIIPSSTHKQVRICPLKRTKDAVTVEYERKKLVYDASTASFVRQKEHLNLPINEYLRQRANPPSDKRQLTDMDLPIPEFLDLFKEHAMEPLFVFQIVCVFLWLLDEYWYYALLTLFMLFILEAQQVQRRRKDLAEIRSVKAPSYPVTVQGARISSDRLCAGDIITLPQENSILPCDLLLIKSSGSVLVNEELLTGESVPVLKQAIEPSSDALNMMKHRSSILLAGTRLVSGTGEACVLRTGFETTQGKLVRTILFASERMTAASSRESGIFLFGLFITALATATYVVYEGLNDRPHPRSRFKLFLSASHILTSVVPPEFPLVLSIAVTLSLAQLASRGVHCTEPFRLPLAAAVDFVVFDKTGTITTPKLRLAEVLGDQVKCRQVLALCHSVKETSSGLVGDPLDLAGCTAGSSDGWKVLKKFPFDPELRRMSVVARSPTGELWVLAKGAGDGGEELAAAGLRVVTLWSNKLSEIPINRDVAETGLVRVGVAGFASEIKPSTSRVISNIVNSKRSCVMLTGDHPLTSIHVAKACGIITGDSPVAVLDSSGQWQPAEAANFPDKYTLCVVCGSPESITVREGVIAQKVKVWARANPAFKEAVVAALARRNFQVMMVGDGTNDVGALKLAAVGLAVTDSGDACVAAPFTARASKDLRCVTLLLRSAAATEAAVRQSYRTMGINALVGAFSFSVLTLNGVKLGDFQTSVEAFAVSVLSFLCSRVPPSAQLPPQQTSHVLGARSLFSLTLQAALHAVLLSYGQWLMPVNDKVGNFLDKPFQPSAANSLAFCQIAAAHCFAFAANFEGAPALPSLREVKSVWNFLLFILFTLLLATSQVFPPLNDLLGLHALPDEVVMKALLLVLGHSLGPLVITRLVYLLVALFC